MNIKQLGEGYFVSGQIQPEHIEALAERGFRSVICNRPDDEVHGQPAFADIDTAATAAGLQTRNIPITHGVLGLAEIENLIEAIKSLPGPILAYCNSGARSAALFGIVSDY